MVIWSKNHLTVKDVPANHFIATYAEYLKRPNKIEIPTWVDYVKTGKNKQLCPYDRDWLYVRAAALARKVYLRAHLGVGALKKIYGGSKNSGSRPKHFVTLGRFWSICSSSWKRTELWRLTKKSE